MSCDGADIAVVDVLGELDAGACARALPPAIAERRSAAVILDPRI